MRECPSCQSELRFIGAYPAEGRENLGPVPCVHCSACNMTYWQYTDAQKAEIARMEAEESSNPDGLRAHFRTICPESERPWRVTTMDPRGGMATRGEFADMMEAVNMAKDLSSKHKTVIEHWSEEEGWTVAMEVV